MELLLLILPLSGLIEGIFINVRQGRNWHEKAMILTGLVANIFSVALAIFVVAIFFMPMGFPAFVLINEALIFPLLLLFLLATGLDHLLYQLFSKYVLKREVPSFLTTVYANLISFGIAALVLVLVKALVP